jgi:hypothetical protein
MSVSLSEWVNMTWTMNVITRMIMRDGCACNCEQASKFQFQKM